MSARPDAGTATPLGSELLRKAIHVAMGGFAVALRWLTPWQAVLCALAALSFNLLLLHRLTRRRLLRHDERESGFSWGIVLYPAAVLALILVFHRRLELAAAVWGLLAFGDGMATVAGTVLGGPRLPWNPRKTWVGLLGFLLYGTAAAMLLLRWTQRAVVDAALGDGGNAAHVGASFLAASLADAVVSDPWFLLAGCGAAALAAGLAESLDSGIDDNILVPLVGGGVLWAATLVEPGRLVGAADPLATRLAWGAGVNAVLALSALAIRSVDRSGAVVGWLLGTALYTFAGPSGFAMLLLFFVLGTAATRVGWSRKAALGLAQSRRGRRGARHALANTTVGVACAFLAAATPHGAAALVGLVAAFATAACDTVSSEIGQAYGRQHRRVTDLRRVPAGTEGAVSLEGTLAGVAAAALVAVAGRGVGLIDTFAVLLVIVGAFVGATVESYVGTLAAPRRAIGNELLNFANTLIGAATATGLFLLLSQTT